MMNHDAPRTIAAYLRTSTDDQAKNETIQAQRDYLTRYIDLHGHTVAKWYEDDGVSGTKRLEDRPAGRQLLHDASLGLFSAVLVYAVDRFGRHLYIILDGQRSLEAEGVDFLSARDSLDTRTPTGKMLFQFLGIFAELEKSTIMDRLNGGKTRIARQGKWVTGAVPYGYELDAGKLVVSAAPVPGYYGTEADLIREIFGTMADGGTTVSVAKSFNLSGVFCRPQRFGNGKIADVKTHSQWGSDRINRIVKSSIYMGEYQFRQTRVKAAGDLVTIPTPAIVDAATWQRANDQLKANKIHGGKSIFDYLLTGKIFCAECGHAYVGTGTTKVGGGEYFYYMCRKDRPNYPGTEVKVCINTRHRAKDLHSRVLDDWPNFRKWLKVADGTKTIAAPVSTPINVDAEIERLTMRWVKKQISDTMYEKLYEEIGKQRVPVVVAEPVVDVEKLQNWWEKRTNNARRYTNEAITRVVIHAEAPRVEIFYVNGQVRRI